MVCCSLSLASHEEAGKETSGTAEKPTPPSAQVTRWPAQTHHRNKPAATRLARPPKPQHERAGGVIDVRLKHCKSPISKNKNSKRISLFCQKCDQQILKSLVIF